MVLKKNKNLKYYFSLPWTYTVETDKDNEGNKIFIVSVNELPGIQTDAPTLSEAFELIKDAMQGAFELYMEIGKQIPEPKVKLANNKKGKIAYSTSSEMHKKLALEAKKRKKPINKIIDEFVRVGLSAKKK